MVCKNVNWQHFYPGDILGWDMKQAQIKDNRQQYGTSKGLPKKYNKHTVKATPILKPRGQNHSLHVKI